jgi:hypothetical protein
LKFDIFTVKINVEFGTPSYETVVGR